MNEEVLKILNEADEDFYGNETYESMDIQDLLEEDEVEFEYLYPEEYERRMKTTRNNRRSTWGTGSKRDLEDEYDYGYGKEGMAARSKTIELNYSDYKEVTDIQNEIMKEKDKDVVVDRQDYKWIQPSLELVSIGKEQYDTYTPVEYEHECSFVSEFYRYLNVFNDASSAKPVPPKWTLQSAISYIEGNREKVSPTSSLELNVIYSAPSAVKSNSAEENLVEASMGTYSPTQRYFDEIASQYKGGKSKNGLPNALCVTEKHILVGMNKSQMAIFDRGSEMDVRPVIFGSVDNASDYGTVFSIAADSSSQNCVIGYSGGSIEIVSLEKIASVKVLARVHQTAVVMVRYLSDSSILSIDYDGNCYLSALNKKLFTMNYTSTCIASAKDYGQIVDCSVCSYDMKKYKKTRDGMVVDLLSISNETTTYVMSLSGETMKPLFMMKRDDVELSERSLYYDDKTKSVQTAVSTCWYIEKNGMVKFVRCENGSVNVWCVDIRVDSMKQIAYSMNLLSTFTLPSLIYGCSILSANHLYCILQNNMVCIVDLTANALLSSICSESRIRYIYGNVNASLQRMMRVEDDDEEGLGGSSPAVVRNNRIFCNSMCSMHNAMYVLCFDRLLVISELDMLSRYEKYVESGDMLNALSVGTKYVSDMKETLDLGNGNEEYNCEMGELRIQYYSFINRFSSSIMKLFETMNEKLPAEYICGSCFEALNRIDRPDLIYSSLFQLTEHGAISRDVYFSVLYEYLVTHTLSTITTSMLQYIIAYIHKQEDAHQMLFVLEKVLISMPFQDSINEFLVILAENGMIFACVALAGNAKGDYLYGVRVILGLLRMLGKNEGKMEASYMHIRDYPNIISVNDAEKYHLTENQAILYSYLFFLLYANIHGVSFSGIQLNPLAKLTNQIECYNYLIRNCVSLIDPSTSLLFQLYFLYFNYVSSLLLSSLTSVPDLSPSQENQALQETMRSLTTNVSLSIVVLLNEIVEYSVDHPTQILYEITSEKIDFCMHLLVEFMKSSSSPDISQKTLQSVFAYIASHTQMVQREGIAKMIPRYSYTPATVSMISSSLLSIGCFAECILLYSCSCNYEKVVQLFVSYIMMESDHDAVTKRVQELCDYCGKTIDTVSKDLNGRLSILAESWNPYSVALLFINSNVFSYALFVINKGDHDAIMKIIQGNEKAVFLYLKHFLLPSYAIPASISGLVAATMENTTVSEESSMRFVQALCMYQISSLSTFIQHNTISFPLAQKMYAYLVEFSSAKSEETLYSEGCKALLLSILNQPEQALQIINDNVSTISEEFQKAIKAVFNIKDLEPSFLLLKSLSQLSPIYTQLFVSLTSTLSYSDIRQSYIAPSWEGVLSGTIAITTTIRKVLKLKIDLNGNRKVIAGLELLDKKAGSILQELINSLQIKIPLPILLSHILSQNHHNTIKDISGIINKVILSLQMDEETFRYFVNIYRNDYNEMLHAQYELMKAPMKGTYHPYSMQNVESERVFVYPCGHIIQGGDSESRFCSICDRDRTNEKVRVYNRTRRIERLPYSVGAIKEITREEESDSMERWKQYKAKQNEVASATLMSIYNASRSNKSQFFSLLEPPAAFSSAPCYPDVARDLLLSQRVPGSLPYKPLSKGECVLLSTTE